MLAEVSETSLKPYQHLELLKTFLIPKLTYELTLGNTHRNTLSKMDVLLRAALTSWLHLPKDTPLAYFHASFTKGDLEVMCFSFFYPITPKEPLYQVPE